VDNPGNNGAGRLGRSGFNLARTDGYRNLRDSALSLKTVQNHISNIFSKLQVVDRAQAIVRAREAGLGAG